MFRLGVPEIILISIICGMPVFIGLIVWAIVSATSKHPKQPTVNSTIPPAADNSPTGKLKELNRLLENNLITQAEFDAKKAEILKEI